MRVHLLEPLPIVAALFCADGKVRRAAHETADDKGQYDRRLIDRGMPSNTPAVQPVLEHVEYVFLNSFAPRAPFQRQGQ